MSNANKQALIPIMTGQYERISAIEAEWGIRFKEGDQRPRIDYFHDAVRALTSGEAQIYAKHSRLSIEHLAYDLSQLRQIQSNPIGRLNRATQMATGDALVKTGPHGARTNAPDRATRGELAQLYKDYTVLFAALFAEVADMNARARMEEIDAAVEDIALVQEVLNALADGQLTAQEAVAQLEQVEQDNLRENIQAVIQGQQILHAQAEAMIAQLAQAEAKLEAQRQTVDSAHTHYVTGQLMVYEEAKETIKRLAMQGMNLAGKFVQNAVDHAAGRGQGGRGV